MQKRSTMQASVRKLRLRLRLGLALAVALGLSHALALHAPTLPHTPMPPYAPTLALARVPQDTHQTRHWTSADIPALPPAYAGTAAEATPPSPAQAAFDDVAGLLLREYGGLAATDRAELVRELAGRLQAVCAPTPRTCPENAAYPVLEAGLTTLGDPHTFLQWPEDYSDYLSSAGGGERVQYGVRLAYLGGEQRLVTEVVAGSGAETAGLRRGDVLETLDGAPYTYTALQKAKGEARAITLGVRRAAVGIPPQRLTLRLQAGRSSAAELPSLYWLEADGPKGEQLKKRTAVLRIPTFLAGGQVAGRVHAAVAEARAGGAAGLIVDLRGNGGGSLSECDLSASAFVPQFERLAVTRAGASLSVVRGGQRWDGVEAGGGVAQNENGGQLTASVPRPQIWQGPLAVLVDSGSASCAEFFAYEVQQSGVGTVVGTPTAGLGNTATRVFPFGQGVAGLQLTVLHYAKSTAGGEAVAYPAQIQPDIYAGDGEDFLQALASGRDLALAAAQQALAGPPVHSFPASAEELGSSALVRGN